MNWKYLSFYFVLMLLILSVASCKHEPFLLMDMDPDPIDTTDNPIDTSMMGIPCDPDLIYFEYDVLPILISNCAINGCHNTTSATDDVILSDYTSVIETADVTAFDLDESKLFKVITDDDPEDRMPPQPNAPLTQEQINVISLWILQGAENLECDPEIGCDTLNVSFSETIRPLLENSCMGCHGGSVPSGGISLESYDGVLAVAQSGQLLGAVKWESGFSAMPQGGNQISDCSIAQIEIWINAGSPDN